MSRPDGDAAVLDVPIEPEVLEVDDLTVTFHRRGQRVRAVDSMSYSVASGRTLAIVGESGSGKTVSSRALMGLLPETARVSGSVRFRGEEILGRPEPELRRLRGAELAMIFQDPARSLNPTMKVGTQITEAIRIHLPVGKAEAREQGIELLRKVRIPAPAQRFDEYPHQLSGGMRQRVMIAIALACRPAVLIADEATTALDVTTQAQIMELLMSLQAELGMAIVMITHDMGLAATYADDVVVMYAGRVVERAGTAELFGAVRMPYTAALLSAIPQVARPSHTALPVVPGRPPDLTALPPGCAFAPRCPRAQEDCHVTSPPLAAPDDPAHAFACHHPIPAAR